MPAPPPPLAPLSPLPAPPAGLPTLAPYASFELPFGSTVAHVELSADGSRAFILTKHQVINGGYYLAWAALWLLTLLALALFFRGVLTLRKTWNKPEPPGRLMCRRCHHDLTDLASPLPAPRRPAPDPTPTRTARASLASPCPECGYPFWRGRLRLGRPARVVRAIAWTHCGLAIAFTVWLWVWSIVLPLASTVTTATPLSMYLLDRDDAGPFGWFVFPAEWANSAARWAGLRQPAWFMTSDRRWLNASRVLEFDTRTGTLTRLLVEYVNDDSVRLGVERVVLSDDARWLALLPFTVRRPTNRPSYDLAVIDVEQPPPGIRPAGRLPRPANEPPAFKPSFTQRGAANLVSFESLGADYPFLLGFHRGRLIYAQVITHGNDTLAALRLIAITPGQPSRQLFEQRAQPLASGFHGVRRAAMIPSPVPDGALILSVISHWSPTTPSTDLSAQLLALDGTVLKSWPEPPFPNVRINTFTGGPDLLDTVWASVRRDATGAIRWTWPATTPSSTAADQPPPPDQLAPTFEEFTWPASVGETLGIAPGAVSPNNGPVVWRTLPLANDLVVAQVPVMIRGGTPSQKDWILNLRTGAPTWSLVHGLGPDWLDPLVLATRPQPDGSATIVASSALLDGPPGPWPTTTFNARVRVLFMRLPPPASPPPPGSEPTPPPAFRTPEPRS